MTLSFIGQSEKIVSECSRCFYIIIYYKGQPIGEESVRNLGFVKQFELIAFYLDIITSVKLRDWNYSE